MGFDSQLHPRVFSGTYFSLSKQYLDIHQHLLLLTVINTLCH